MAITELEITKRTSFASGESFDDVGAYELLEGTAYYAVDPFHARNQGITDLDLAPRNSAGKVEFSADFAMLRPVNIDRGNRRILFDVVNRGRKTALSMNSVPAATDPTAPLEAGNGYLMRRGYTVVWGGWQADVPTAPGLIGLIGLIGWAGSHRPPGTSGWQDSLPVPVQRTHPGVPAGRPAAPAQSGRRPYRSGGQPDGAGPAQQSCCTC